MRVSRVGTELKVHPAANALKHISAACTIRCPPVQHDVPADLRAKLSCSEKSNAKASYNFSRQQK